MTLRDALCNPNYVSHLLLFELDESVEDAKVKLVQIRVNVEFDL